MKKQLLFLMVIFSLTLVSAATESCLANTFEINESVNYRFRCYTESGDYCSSTTKLIINVEYPDGSSALNNVSLSYNQTYFNSSLPTDQLGRYTALIHSTTSNNSISEFPYDVTLTGDCKGTGYLLVANLFMIILILGLLVMAVKRYGDTDFEKKEKSIVNKHEGKGYGSGYFRTFGRTFVYGLMKHSFLWYYSAGWLLLFFINEIMLNFASASLYTYFVLVMNIYSIGFLLVFAVFIGMIVKHFEHIREILDDINLGVEER